jgi:hypothetical protein
VEQLFSSTPAKATLTPSVKASSSDSNSKGFESSLLAFHASEKNKCLNSLVVCIHHLQVFNVLILERVNLEFKILSLSIEFADLLLGYSFLVQLRIHSFDILEAMVDFDQLI